VVAIISLVVSFSECGHLWIRPNFWPGLVLWVSGAGVVRTHHLVPCSRGFCRRTRGQWEASNIATCGTRGCSGNPVVCWSYRGLHNNVRPPGFRLHDVLFPRLPKVWFPFPVMVERTLANPSQLENFHVLDSWVPVLHRESSRDLVVFSLTHTGQVPLQCLGAACAIAAQTVPSWAAAFEGNNVSGLLAEMLSPAGTFGKILVVLLAIGLTSDIASTFYSITLNFQILVPRLVALPRYLLSLAATAVYVRSQRPQTAEAFIKLRC